MSTNMPGMMGAGGMYSGNGPMNAVDPGAPDAAGSMFRFIANNMPGAPTPDDMRAEMERVRFVQNVIVTSMRAEVYDMSVPAERVRYCADKVKLFDLIKLKKASLNAMERKFAPRDGKWLMYLEWFEFELEVKDTQMKPGEAGNG